jgi:hypothetical protein
MKTIFISAFLFSFSALALPPVVCESDNVKLTIVQNSKGEIYMTYQLESAIADGLLDAKEVDLIAKFATSGEMTLVAKIGEASKDNYLFFNGKRNPVTCK